MIETTEINERRRDYILGIEEDYNMYHSH